MSTYSGFRYALTSLAGVTLLSSASAVFAQSSQNVTITNASENLTALVANDPGDILNCFEVYFPGANLYAIVPDKPANGPVFTDQMRALAKNLANKVILLPGNYSNDQFVTGQTYGVEFDWFYPGATNPPMRPNLPYPVSVFLAPGSGVPATLFSKVYSYDHANYAVRKAALEALIGHPMDTFVVWLGPAMVSTSMLWGGGIEVSGSQNQMAGSLEAAGNVQFSGALNDVEGAVSAVSTVDLGVGNTADEVFQAASQPEAALVLDENYLRNLAKSYGLYSAGSLTLTNANIGSSGIVFAEGDLVVSADGLQGDWAFVSASGNIDLGGDGHQLESALGSVIAISYRGDLSFTSTNAQVVGESYAPGGTIDVTGTGNSLLGTLEASQVKVSGSANLLSDGTIQAP